METYKKLREAYLKLVDEFYNGNNEVAEKILLLKLEVKNALKNTIGKENQNLKELYDDINDMKQEFDSDDEESTIDMMYPNRDEEDADFDDIFDKD